MAGALPGPVPLDEAKGTTLRLGSDGARLDRVSLVSIALARALIPSHTLKYASNSQQQLVIGRQQSCFQGSPREI